MGLCVLRAEISWRWSHARLRRRRWEHAAPHGGCHELIGHRPQCPPARTCAPRHADSHGLHRACRVCARAARRVSFPRHRRGCEPVVNWAPQACANGHVECVRLLISHGAKYANNDSGNSPMHWAVLNKVRAGRAVSCHVRPCARARPRRTCSRAARCGGLSDPPNDPTAHRPPPPAVAGESAAPGNSEHACRHVSGD